MAGRFVAGRLVAGRLLVGAASRTTRSAGRFAGAGRSDLRTGRRAAGAEADVSGTLLAGARVGVDVDVAGCFF